MPTKNEPGRLLVREVFTRLEGGGMLSPEQRSLALKLLAPDRHQLRQAITFLTVIGAWFSAWAFTGFVFTLLEPKDGAGIMIGLGYCVSATLLRRIARHDFFVQAALAILLAGSGIVLISVYGGFSHSTTPMREWAACGTAVLLAAVLYVVYDYPVQRFIVPLGAFFVVFGTILDQVTLHWLNCLHLLVLVETLGVLFVFAGPTRRAAFRPLGHALAVALGVTVGPMVMPLHNSLYYSDDIIAASMMWPSRAILAAALVWLTCWAGRLVALSADSAAGSHCLRTVVPDKRAPVLVALGTIVLLGLVSSPGILAGFLLAALGHATRERLVAALGLVVLGGAVFFFCDYELVLSARAGLLVASGLVLLGARFVLWRLTASGAKEGTL